MTTFSKEILGNCKKVEWNMEQNKLGNVEKSVLQYSIDIVSRLLIHGTAQRNGFLPIRWTGLTFVHMNT